MVQAIGIGNYGLLMRRAILHCTLICLLATLASPCLAQRQAATAPELISAFQSEPVFWRQEELGEQIAAVAKLQDLSPLEPWLAHKDRHVRGNVAWLFARLGDPRGFDTLVGILDDHSAERAVYPPAISLSQPDRLEEYLRSPEALGRQIYDDRYYAVHLLGTLKDPRALDVLIPLLDHDEVNYNAAWAIGEIGGARAVAPLIAALSHRDPQVRVGAVFALEHMRAKEALPHLAALFDDPAVPSGGEQVPIGTTARRAAETIRALRQ